MPHTGDADVIVGYRANDSYFSFANAFLNNTLSLEQLRRAMYLGRLGLQIVLKSETAFRGIKYIDGVYLIDILRGDWKNDDPRLR